MDNKYVWEKIYKRNDHRHKNMYPCTDVISFIMKNYGHIQDKHSVSILELGCGWGNNLYFLNDMGFDYYGIDYSHIAVDHCMNHFNNVLYGDFVKIPFNDGFFDCVFDRMSVMYNSKDKIIKIFDEIDRVLKPGGCFMSVLASVGNFEPIPTYLSYDEVVTLGEHFGCGYSIDFNVFSRNDGVDVFKTYVLMVKKE